MKPYRTPSVCYVGSSAEAIQGSIEPGADCGVPPTQGLTLLATRLEEE